MSAPNFIDHVRIHCRSGNGGAGSRHFRREKYIPKGGPDGGDGGRGGHVIIRANAQLWTLLPLRYQKHIRAGHGAAGSGSESTGAEGEDVIVEVPLGTVAKNPETNEIIVELTEDGQEAILVQGGQGGRGNVHFKSSTRQAPQYAQAGTPLEEAWIVLELKVLADVGLVGLPNAGKSTLLSVISAAKPKIASYAFTTLVPNLGIVSYRDQGSFVMADIPGIIEGAHEGKGLGVRFLRHIERNSTLLFMVPADSDDIKKEYALLLNELKEYSEELMHKERLLAITKIDMLDAELLQELKQEVPADVDVVYISAVSGTGLDVLKDALWKKMGRG